MVELVRRGHSVSARPWNAAPLSDFTDADLVVLRSNWDFHHLLQAFEQWLTDVELTGTEIRNSPTLVRAYNHKSYLQDLSDLGFPVAPTLVTSDFGVGDISGWADRHDIDLIVFKPAWGASGHGVQLVERADLEAARTRWLADPNRRPMLAQQYVPQVVDGEYSLVFFDGEFSHAVLRSPGRGEYRTNSQYGGSVSLVTDIDPAMVELAWKAAATLPVHATYLRVDLVNAEEPLIMEIEVNEPALWLQLAPGSAARFADALLSSPRAPR